MEIEDWVTTPRLSPRYRDLRERGLEGNVAELEAFGFTVLTPEQAGVTPDLVERLRDAVVAVSERRAGRAPDLEDGTTHGPGEGATGEHLYYMLYEDPVFEEALMNPVALQLITYLLGDSALVSSVTATLKGPGGPPLALHSDNAGVPAPFPAYAQVANATFVLTDYTKENGALRVVPGSHRWGRQPSMTELFPGDDGAAVPIEAPAGSVIVWHGNTWHGAYQRTAPGLRINLILYFCRSYLKTQEDYPGSPPEGLFERNPERLRTLLGEQVAYGWREEGPDKSKLVVLQYDAHA